MDVTEAENADIQCLYPNRYDGRLMTSHRRIPILQDIALSLLSWPVPGVVVTPSRLTNMPAMSMWPRAGINYQNRLSKVRRWKLIMIMIYNGKK